MHQDPACLFCKIVKGDVPCYKVWEDSKHLAFLTPFPNTEGFTVVITKEHHQAYAFDLPDAVLADLVLAAKKVGKLLDASFEDVGRTGMLFEGFGVNHVHAKLFPTHGTKMDTWTRLASTNRKFFDQYEGYISSHDGPQQTPEQLESTLAKIRAAQHTQKK